MRIGVFGGTFDPIHIGHLIVAEAARAEAQLEHMLFVLSPRPPHKEAAELASVSHRLAMLRLALNDNPRFVISTLEVQREGPSYTVDTLRQLKARPEYAAAEFYLLLGMDNLTALAQWREPHAILKLAQLLVYPRLTANPKIVSEEFQPACRLLDSPIVEISSTEIRRRLQQGQTIRYLVPESVRLYLEANRLYR